LHPSDQNPPTPGRPSFNSPDQESPGGYPRIVGGLDCLDGEPAPKWGLAKFPWALSGALLLTIGAATMLWSGDDSGKQIIVAGTEPVIAEPAPLPEASTEEMMETDAPLPIMVKEDAAPSQVEPPPVKLVDLDVAAPPRAKHRASTAKPPKKPRPNKKPKAPSSPKVKPALPRLESMSQADKDVALLAAVVTHTKAIQAAPLISVKWKQCGAAKSVAAAKRCRAQLCASNEDAPECGAARSAPVGVKP
jgi:hypothetical protein